jgi:hypothetical protein
LPGLRGSASVAGTHAPAPGVGCWAERSACPWPRLSLLVAIGIRSPSHESSCRWTRLPLVSSSVLLASRRGLQSFLVAAVSPRAGDCSRVLRRFRWVKPPRARPTHTEMHYSRHNRHAVLRPAEEPVSNVAERLAPGQKTVSFWQCRFHNVAATDNEARMPDTSRAHSTHHRCDEPRPAASSPVDNTTTTAVLSPQPVDNYVDSSSSFIWSFLVRPEGVLVFDS